SLEILKFNDSVESLFQYTDEDYQTFHLLSLNIEEGVAFSIEPFSDSFLGLSKKNVSLQQDVQLLLSINLAD
ncbi:16068_t:CDS:2, partial [Funneliformis mosseae]